MAKRPNWICLEKLQKHSTRGWVERQGEGWIFVELTPDELAEFKSYGPDITIPKMKVRFPFGFGQGAWFRHLPDNVANWFAYCTMPQAPLLIQVGFRIHPMTDLHKGHPVPDSYEGWLWADEVKICREVGCEVTVHYGCSWLEWKPPITRQRQYKERSSIYALVDEVTQEIGYVGEGRNPKQRYAAHLRGKDAENPAKWVWIQRLRREGRKPGLRILEENIAGKDALERENYWIKHYWELGHNLTNAVCQNWPKPDIFCHVSLPLD